MTYEIGRGKPPKKYQIGQPDGPKPGKTKETARKEAINAAIALELRSMLLDALMDVFKEGGDILKHLDPHTLKLLKDAEDRGLGAPVQPTVDLGDDNAPKGMKDFYGLK